MVPGRQTLMPLVLALVLPLSFGALAASSPRESFALDAQASGVIETINNIANLTIVSKDANDLKAEYRAGFVQGRLQAKAILAARDNAWDLLYLTDPTHAFPRQPGPARDEIERAARLLGSNYGAFIRTLKSPATDTKTAYQLKRLLFRLVGIYHGTVLETPAALDFGGDWLPDAPAFRPEELALGYETPKLTFMDVYFVNAAYDMADVLANLKEAGLPAANPEKCSAFLKRVGTNIILTHNSWQSFLAQNMTMTLAINGDLLTVNAGSPGWIGSGTDFGYNNKGTDVQRDHPPHGPQRGQAGRDLDLLAGRPGRAVLRFDRRFLPVDLDRRHRHLLERLHAGGREEREVPGWSRCRGAASSSTAQMAGPTRSAASRWTASPAPPNTTGKWSPQAI